MPDAEVLVRWLEDDTPVWDQARVKERWVRYRAPWCEVFTALRDITEKQVLCLSPEDERVLQDLDWIRKHGHD